MLLVAFVSKGRGPTGVERAFRAARRNNGFRFVQIAKRSRFGGGAPPSRGESHRFDPCMATLTRPRPARECGGLDTP